MEAVTAGEMWSVIYEGATGYSEGELPIEHGRCGGRLEEDVCAKYTDDVSLGKRERRESVESHAK